MHTRAHTPTRSRHTHQNAHVCIPCLPPPHPTNPPQLAQYPSKYIYEPWTAPLEVQQRCGCVVGRDYPFPVVEHTAASRRNMERMKAAYAANKWVPERA